MDIQKIFKAVSQDPDRSTLIVVVTALEAQGYEVSVNDRYSGSDALAEAEEKGDLDRLPMQNGVILRIKQGEELQSFRIHFLDIDAICFTDTDSPPVMYNPDFTTGFYKSGENN